MKHVFDLVVKRMFINSTEPVGKRLDWESLHCVKSGRVRSYSGPHFPAFGLNTEG